MKRPEGFDRPAEPPEPPRQPGAKSARRRPAGDTPARDRPARAERVRRERAPREKRELQQKKTRETPSPSAAPAIVRPARPARQARQDAGSGRSAKAQARAQLRHERAETRRFTRQTRRRRVTWLVIGGIFVLLLVVLGVAVFSPILALKTIRIEGASAVKATAVRSALDDQLGTPLALLDTGRIDRDLSRFALIRSYVIEIVPPSTLVVRIVERRAIAVMADGSTFDQVDPAGVVLKTSPTRAGLPIIDIGSAKAGSPAFGAAVKVLLALPSSVAGRVQTVSASTLDNVSLTLTGDNHTVIWGSADDSDQKAATLARLLQVGTCKSKPVINVTAPLNGACGPRQVTPTSTPTPTTTPTPPPGG